jgi:hypothetical protein
MYGEKKYEGPETLVVAMDIGTTQSEQRLIGWGWFDSVFQARCHSRTSLREFILKDTQYFPGAIIKFYLTIESGRSLAGPGLSTSLCQGRGSSINKPDSIFMKFI